LVASPERQRAAPAWWRKRVYLFAAMSGAFATMTSAAVISSKFGARDPRSVAVISEFGSDSSRAARARIVAATAAVRRAIAQSNLVTLLDTAEAESRAGTLVRVSVEQHSTGYRLVSSIVDRAGGVIRSDISATMNEVKDQTWQQSADRVASGLAAALYPGWAGAQSAPPSLAAYRAFVEGMNQIVREDHASAISLFLDAYHSDSAFAAAGLLAGAELLHTRRYAAADSLVRAIAARRSTLPAVEREMLNWLQYSLAGNRRGAYAAMQEVTRRAPGAELAWLQLATEAAENGDPQLSLRLFESMRDAQMFGKRWLAYWANRAKCNTCLDSISGN
jgi:hypothetical protein